MKNHISYLLRLTIVTLAAYPAFVLAAPAAGSAYYTDETNSYVQDQTSKIMGNLNNILCFMGAMAPDQMVNAGNYIALVDKNACNTSGSGGQSSNKGAAYSTVVVNSARASSTADMLVKAWLDFPEDNQKISVYATASQAPSASLPYGVFRMDFCANTADCTLGRGFINAPSTGGLSFYDGGTQGGQTYSTALQLNATSATAGSGIAQDINPWDGNSTFYFAYNDTHFIRNSGGASTCFNRDDAAADESVWRYGLYDATTGAQIARNSGFPIEYDNGAGVISNGYIGYHGLWMPVTVPNNATVNKVTYSASGATKTPYKLLKTGGKLNKFTTVLKTLADLHKVTFWYYAQQNVGAAMTANSQYELYWDNTTTPKQFYVSGKQGTSGNMEPYATPVALDNAAMAAATPWGLFGWSQMMGGQFGIKGSDFINLATNTSTTPVVTQIQGVVYPSDYATIGGNGKLNCINDCPTAALITSSNAGTGPAYSNQGWTPVSTTVPYTFDATTKNMEDATLADVISAATTGANSNGVRSGRLVTDADMADIISAKTSFCTTYSISPCTYNQGDVDLLPEGRSYYVWETGGNSWNQLAILMNGTVPVPFEAPLPVKFIVPTGAKYGSYQGATISLMYGGFGDLWGIPNACIDITTNAACDFTPTTGTAQNNMRWTPKFSIPFDTTNGIVTAGTATYFAKPLDKEVRLAKVDCSATSLTAPAAGSVTLPNVTTDWIDPTVAGKTTGSAPAVTAAPQVIHGVKQY